MTPLRYGWNSSYCPVSSAVLIHSHVPCQELQLQCDSLHREKDQLLAELDRLRITPSSSPSPGDEEEQASVLQQSFEALQQRFKDVMAEKAAMHEQIHEREHIIIQLAGETETITEYVTLYQTQREALKIRFEEKNKLIQQLAQEKAALEVSNPPPINSG